MSNQAFRMASALNAFLERRAYDDGMLQVRGDALADKGANVVERVAERIYLVRHDQADSDAARERLQYAQNHLSSRHAAVRVSQLERPGAAIRDAIEILQARWPEKGQTVYALDGHPIGTLLLQDRSVLLYGERSYLWTSVSIPGLHGLCWAGLRPHEEGWRMIPAKDRRF